MTVFLLLLPLNAAPLGLGDIELRSSLNQPLEAEIELTALGQTRIDDVTVRLASREAFAQAGIDRPLFLGDLTFTIEPRRGDTAIVRIGSRSPIVEPFLDVLIEVNWPNGRLLREYTVLLDPPLLLDEAPAPIAAPAAGTPSQARTGEAGERPPTASAGGRPAATLIPSLGREEGGAWNYGPVERDATLWSIASDLRALDTSYSVEQIMMALLRDNPEAFYNNNVNELKAGFVLRIDDPASIAAISHAAAVAEARRQGEQWLDAKRATAEAAGSRPQRAETAPTGPDAAQAAPAGPRLRLSAPDVADIDRLAAGAAETGEAQGESVQRLREDLAEALEVSESARQENVDLRQRLAELEEQIASMQRLLSLQEDSLAALQARSGAQAESQGAPAARQRAPAPEAATGDDPLTRMLNDPMLLGVAGGALLLLATLGWLIARRRRIARATVEQFTVEPVTPSARSREPLVPSKAAPAGAMGGLTAEDFDEEAVASAMASAEDSGVDLMQADEDEIDILAEADVYLAYRRFDKAEELLRDAMQEDPERRDIVLKLLEVYAASGDADAFVAQAESFKASMSGGTDAPTWDKVVAMGKRLVPGHALFAAAAQGGAVESPAPAGPADADGLGVMDDLPEEFGLDTFDREIEGIEEEEALSAIRFDESGADATGEGQAVFEAADLDLTLDEETLSDFEETAPALANSDAGQGGGSARDDAPASMHEADAGMQPGFDTGEEGYPGAYDAIGAEFSGLDAGIDAGRQPDDADAVEELEPGREAASAEMDLGDEIDWLAAVGNDLATFESDAGEEEAEDFSGLITGSDEVGTKLDLAKAYIDMGDQESARNILSEVTEEGSEDQQREASDLMRQIG